LRMVAESSRAMIGFTMGKFAATMGDNPGLQSGIAIQELQDRGDVSNNKYMGSREIAQKHTGRILVNAIPRAYEQDRQVRMLKEDGEQEMVTIGEEIIDEQTGMPIIMRDLSKGIYDVDIHSGPSFSTRQNETVKTITEIAKVDPSILETGSDILLSNIQAPGMAQLAKRKRRQLIAAGMIPEEQMSEEEAAEYEAVKNQPKEPSPEMVLAQAEDKKGQAALMREQNAQVELEINSSINMDKQKQSAHSIKIDEFKALTDRMKVMVDDKIAGADVVAKTAAAAKDLAMAEGQDLENAAALSGITGAIEDLADAVGG